MKLPTAMKFAPDLSHLDRAYRAKRSGMSPVEYAASVQHFRRPRRHVLPWVVTLALLAGALLIGMA